MAPEVRTWERGMAGHWDRAVKGSSSLRAAMRRLVRMDNARHGGLDIVQVLWGAEKFYDSLGVNVVLQHALRLGMHPVVVVMCCISYLQPRVLMAQGSVSEEMEVDSNIVAGCKFANTMARVAVYFVLQRLHEDFPGWAPEQYVDDMPQVGEGEAKELIEMMGTVGIRLVTDLRKLGIKMSSKSVILGSSKAACEGICKETLAGAGVALTVVDCAKDLGVGTSAGRFRPSRFLKVRIRKAAERAKRIQGLSSTRRMGWIKVKKSAKGSARRTSTVALSLFSTGAWPQGSYGIPATGLTPTDVHQIQGDGGQGERLPPSHGAPHYSAPTHHGLPGPGGHGEAAHPQGVDRLVAQLIGGLEGAGQAYLEDKGA